MSEIKLNTWQWGVVPELHPEAVLRLGGHLQGRPQYSISLIAYCSLTAIGCEHDERWYAVLSLGPPEMPEEELRLPEGWSVEDDAKYEHSERWSITICDSMRKRPVDATMIVNGDSRRECVREINRLLEGK